jgi:hypothetical protein
MAQLSIVSSLEHQNGLVDRNPCFGDTLEHCPRHVAALGQRQRVPKCLGGGGIPYRHRHRGREVLNWSAALTPAKLYHSIQRPPTPARCCPEVAEAQATPPSADTDLLTLSYARRYTSSYLTLRQSRSTNTLSRQAPFPLHADG